jgi:rhodanese-related sulfurtransferase
MDFIQDNILLVALAVVSGVMLVFPMLRERMSGVAQADTLETTRMINKENAVVLDVREDAEIQGGRILGARHIPLSKLAGRVKELEKHKNKPIVAVCRSGNRSVSACGVLKKQGFEKVYNLAGGMIAWEKAGLPVEK